MGGGGAGHDVDGQSLKRAAAAAYEYERDPRWSEYWSNVLIPPRLAYRSDVVDHFKQKFYKRYVDSDLVVESMPSISQPSRPSGRSGSPAGSEQARDHKSGSSIGTSRTAPPPTVGSAKSVCWNGYISQLSCSILVIFLFLCITPTVPKNVACMAYRLSLLHGAFSSLFFLYRIYGIPGIWSLTSIQAWFQSIVGNRDFLYFVYCLMFVTLSPRLKFSVLPLLCREIEYATMSRHKPHNFKHLSFYRKLLEKFFLWVEANTNRLNHMASNAEIALGFLLVLSLFSWQRSMMHTFLYWHLLKVMYHSPATAGYHQSSWARIGRVVYPYINRYMPFLTTPLSTIERWWLT